ncbi:MAG: permease-like cell division protein FtsX [Muribaculaceae bacterium]|nr:permease-like cell division protein FtsX [Muribaculaceae bacterium]
MKSRKGFSSLSVQATATISVALVLLLLGMVASLGLSARSITTDIKEHMGFDVVLGEQASLDRVNEFKQLFTDAPYVASFRYFSPEQANDTWREEMGENLTELLDVNPFLPEFEINVKAAYANPDSLDAIVLPLQQMEDVYEVNAHSEVAEQVNRNMSTLMWVLTIAALALLPISFVLINNTIRLTIFSRRFMIHTMKLVGASRGFIRRPFMISNLLQALIASVIASALLGGMYVYIWSLDGTLRSVLTERMLLNVCGGMLVAGIILCFSAALFATQRYLTRSYDELF